MEKITSYFILFTGGMLVWKHINRNAIKSYLFYSFSVAFLAVLFSIFLSPIFYLLFFFFLSLTLIFVGALTFYIEKLKGFVLNKNSTLEDAKYTLFFIMYVGIFGAVLTSYSFFCGSFLRI